MSDTIRYGGKEYPVEIKRIDGCWFITSDKVKGLCAAHRRLTTAVRIARGQIERLVRHAETEGAPA